MNLFELHPVMVQAVVAGHIVIAILVLFLMSLLEKGVISMRVLIIGAIGLYAVYILALFAIAAAKGVPETEVYKALFWMMMLNKG